jgi:hypothetical protein
VIIFIGYSTNILFFESTIPGLEPWTQFPKKIEIDTRRLRHGDWLINVRRLSMHYEIVMDEFDVDIPS